MSNDAHVSRRATATVQEDNDKVRVTLWRFAPGANTGWHRHEFDYVVVPVTDGRLRLLAEAGDSEAELRAGESYFRRAGVAHDVINAGEGDLAFVEIEMKDSGAL